MDFLESPTLYLLAVLTVVSIGYVVFATVGVWLRGRPSGRRSPPFRPPVTILKPLCGLDPKLHENLRSFCEQDYPRFQIVFGVRDRGEPALAIVARIVREFPRHDIAVVVDDRVIGPNFKISNLANMHGQAKHDIIVIADSDMRVDRDYLETVVAPFHQHDVGAVTCLYTGIPDGGLPSRAAAMFVNSWFLPSVLVSLTLQELNFCFGATMCIRRDALARIGGFEALSSYLADDYMLGNLVSQAGFQVKLAPCVVENVVFEPDFKTLFRHELRWARTVRTVRPLGFSFLFITNPVPLSLLALVVSGFAAVGVAAVAAAVVARLALHYAVAASFRLSDPGPAWFVPFRDILCFAVWGASFLGRSVSWREHRFTVGPRGRMASVGPEKYVASE